MVRRKLNNIIKPLIIIFYTSALIIQILVILKAIPFSWVNGGISKDYEAQVMQSLISIVVIAVIFNFVIKALNMHGVVSGLRFKALYGITVFWTLGFIMQLAGTFFERYVLSIVLLLGVLSHIKLIRQIHAHKNQ